MENNRTCEIFNVNLHSASMQKHLKLKKHLEKKTKRKDYTRMVI